MKRLVIGRDLRNGIPHFDELAVLDAPQLAIGMARTSDAAFGMGQNELSLCNRAVDALIL